MLKVSIKINSQLHHNITKGVERFGDNYRYRHEGNWFTIIGKSKDKPGWFNLHLNMI